MIRKPRSWAAGALVAISLGTIGCSASESPKILDTENVEQAIEQSSLAQRGQDPRVTCPSGVHQTEGLMFDCIAVVDNFSTRFVVTQVDGSGRVRFIAP
jgi:hypothetical protein